MLRAFPSAGPKDDKGALHHESRKNEGAFAWVRFHVKSRGGALDLAAVDPVTKPTLTYSRPKGEYVFGSPDHTRFLIDYFVTGCTLTPAGYHVVATLDGKKRTLKSDEIVVADARRAQSLAGVIGGGESEVSASTVDVVLEVATWDPVAVRRARREGSGSGGRRSGRGQGWKT